MTGRSKLNFPLTLALLLTMTAPLAAEAEVRRWIVTSPLAPVFETMQAASGEEGGDLLLKPEMAAFAMAYGDVVDAEPAGRDGWLALRLGPDGAATGGFVEAKLMTLMPDYTPLPAQSWQVMRPTELFLLPGRLPLAAWGGASLPRGAVASVSGSAVGPDGRTWLLCVFETNPASGDVAGSNRRCAWARAQNLADLSATTPDLTQVEVEKLPEGLTQDERKFLTHSGFFLDPIPVASDDGIGDLYAALPPERPKFITADLALHAFLVQCGQALTTLEERSLLPRLVAFMDSLQSAADRLPQSLESSEPGRTAAANVKNLIAIAAFMMSGNGASLTAEARPFALGMLRGEGSLPNPFTGGTQDMAAFQPEGHYALNSNLTAWFRVMHLLSTPWPLDTEEGAAAVLILNRIMRTQSVHARWLELIAPLRYLMGSSTVNAFDDLSEALSPFSLADLGTPERVKELMAALKRSGKNGKSGKSGGIPGLTDIPGAFAIVPRGVPFELMVFDALTWPAVGSGKDRRALPDPLDVLAVLGSLPARNEVKLFESYRGYAENLGAMRELWRQRASAPEGKNLQTEILKCLQAYLGERGAKQYFATQPSWGYKRLITAGGAMTALACDVGPRPARGAPGLDVPPAPASGSAPAPTGGPVPGAFRPPLPRGYLEPVPTFYRALAGVADHMEKVIAVLLPEGARERGSFTAMAAALERLAGIAERALKDEMTYDDFYRLHRLRLPSWPPAGNAPTAGAVVMGGMTSRDPESPTVLYMGTGTPRRIIVYLNDCSGGFRVAEGYTFSFYSFAQPLSVGWLGEGRWRVLVRGGLRQDELQPLLPWWAGRVYE